MTQTIPILFCHQSHCLRSFALTNRLSNQFELRRFVLFTVTMWHAPLNSDSLGVKKIKSHLIQSINYTKKHPHNHRFHQTPQSLTILFLKNIHQSSINHDKQTLHIFRALRRFQQLLTWKNGDRESKTSNLDLPLETGSNVIHLFLKIISFGIAKQKPEFEIIDPTLGSTVSNIDKWFMWWLIWKCCSSSFKKNWTETSNQIFSISSGHGRDR